MGNGTVVIKAKLILQIHPDGVNKNLIFTTDPFLNLNDCWVEGDEWKNAQRIVEDVQIILSKDVERHLCDTEFLSTNNTDTFYEADPEVAAQFMDQVEADARATLTAPVEGP